MAKEKAWNELTPLAEASPFEVQSPFQPSKVYSLTDNKPLAFNWKDGIVSFVLDDLRQRTGGRTVEANRALVLNNARVAAELASALAQSPA